MNNIEQRLLIEIIKIVIDRVKSEIFLFGIVTILLIIVFKDSTILILIVYLIGIIAFIIWEFIKTKRELISPNEAPYIDFKMRMYYKPFSKPFANLETKSDLVSSFKLIIDKTTMLGKSGKFERPISSDQVLRTNFFVDNENDIAKIVKSLDRNNGYLFAEVSLNNGTKYQYKYKADTNNWSRVIKGIDNMSDTFTLNNKTKLK